MRNYNFKEIKNCEMCNAPTANHKTLGLRLDRSHGNNPRKITGIAVGVKQCDRCKLIYSNPQPIPHDIQDHYGTPPEDYWKPEYFKWSANYFLSQTKLVKEQLSFEPGMTALDIGAGLGKAMLTLTNEGFETYGLEPSIPFYNRAIEKMNIPKDRLKLGAMEDLEYDTESFNFITFGAVVEHLYSPKYCIAKAMKWLKPNGIIHIEVPSSNWLIAKLINRYYRLRGTNYVTNLSPMHNPFHLYEFTHDSFEELGKELGYTIEHYEYTVCELFFIPKILHPIFRWYMKKTNKGLQLTVYLKKNS